jgi:pimeloyl-ACP methyl ester carboxylesterase
MICDVVLPVDDVGAGAPVMLLHAGVADRTMWSEHLGALADAGLRVVAPDLPGFGEAPAAREQDAPWVDAVETLEALGIERAHLVGNSLGGLVAQRIAVVAPERVRSLVLISSGAPGIEPSPELEAAWSAEESALEAGDIEAAVAAVLDAWTLPDAPAELRVRVSEMQRRAFELQLGVEASLAHDPLEEDPDALARILAPALVLAGEHDMRDFHLAAEALTGTLPNARRDVIEGAGHLAPLEQPQSFREQLLAFIAEVD